MTASRIIDFVSKLMAYGVLVLVAFNPLGFPRVMCLLLILIALIRLIEIDIELDNKTWHTHITCGIPHVPWGFRVVRERKATN
jgi:hypothetical protein